MSAILEVKDLHVRYGDYAAVKGVSFSLERGGILGIVGESGSGKSTIAKVLMGLHPEYSGTISSCPRDDSNNPTIGKSNNSLAMIFQDAVGSLNPRMTVRQTLAEVLAHVRRGDRIVAPTNHESQATNHEPRATTPLSLLEQVGLSSAVLDQYPRELSGGQCQRVSVARALATNPEILIADEPVSALDVSVQARVLNLLRDLRRELGLSILLIAHDLAVVKNVCDSICVMERGVFVDVGPSETVFNNPQSEYTRRLLSAVPKL